MVGRQLRRVSHSQLLLKREIEQHVQQQETLRKEKVQEQARKKRRPITVHVQILTGRQIHLLLDVQDSLDDVREKILVKEGIHPDQQVLLFNGIKLMDGTVEELSIQEGAVLFLTLRNRGG